MLDADAVSSAAALAESDALLQATEAAWYPTIGVQRLVELLHERSELPWYNSATWPVHEPGIRHEHDSTRCTRALWSTVYSAH